MRHRVQHRKLGRTSAHRKALFRNQLTALFTHERIITTLAKAKTLRPVAERIVTKARTGTLAARRDILTMVQDKEIVSRLFDEIAPRFSDRPGGYLRIMRLGRRHGDAAELAIIEFVDYELSAKPTADGDKKPSLMDRAKGMLGGAAKEEGGDETPAEAEAAEAAEAAEEASVEEETKPKKKAAPKKTTKKAEAKADDAPAEEAKPKKKAAPKKTAKKADDADAKAKPKKATAKKADVAEAKPKKKPAAKKKAEAKPAEKADAKADAEEKKEE
ncbi:MAG: 50S ribosomal protein L17 [bacterium]|nr:50S ribosomal protein L17 [bacterium]